MITSKNTINVRTCFEKSSWLNVLCIILNKTFKPMLPGYIYIYMHTFYLIFVVDWCLTPTLVVSQLYRGMDKSYIRHLLVQDLNKTCLFIKQPVHIYIIVTDKEGNIRIYRLPKGCGMYQLK